MNDIQLYQQILGLTAPWKVESVLLNRPAQAIEVRVVGTETVWGRAQCHQRLPGPEWQERRWRHPRQRLSGFQTYLAARLPVVACPTHGAQTIQVPWAEPYGRFTRLMERLAIDLMRDCSVVGACGMLRISWDQADGIKPRAVARGLRRKQARTVTRLGVDEKSAGRGQNYVTVVAGLEPGVAAKVECVGDGRKQGDLDGYWQQLSPPQREQVEAVAMNMSSAYYAATVAHVPEAKTKIVHDPFHLACHLHEARDQVRQAEHRVPGHVGDDRLVGTKHLWRYGWENPPAVHPERFAQLRRRRLKTGRAWAVKGMFRDFWASETLEEGRRYFGRWYGCVVRSRLEPIKRVARCFKAHLANILTYFTHRITNAA